MPAPRLSGLGLSHRGVVTSTAPRCERDTARLDLAEPHPKTAPADGAVRAAQQARFVERAKRGLAQQHRGSVGAGRPLDGVDHGDAAPAHPAVQIVDVEDPRRQVVDVGGTDAGDVGGHRRHPR